MDSCYFLEIITKFKVFWSEKIQKNGFAEVFLSLGKRKLDILKVFLLKACTKKFVTHFSKGHVQNQSKVLIWLVLFLTIFLRGLETPLSLRVQNNNTKNVFINFKILRVQDNNSLLFGLQLFGQRILLFTFLKMLECWYRSIFFQVLNRVWPQLKDFWQNLDLWDRVPRCLT